MKLGRIKVVEPKSVWEHEAHDLTPWLLGNADVLADVLGIDLEITVAEHPVGAFSLDLLGRDLTNDCVLIVENQLTPTDHDHLGKLVTYAAGTDAGTVVWLAPTFRAEHRQALDMLNELGGDRIRFFGVQLGVIRIDDSAAAPLLEIQAQPNDWHAQVSAAAKSNSQAGTKAAAYVAFWTRLLDRLAEEHPQWTKSRKGGSANWMSMPCRFKGGPYFAFSFAQGGRLRDELYIDFASDPDRADALYEALHARRAQIEAVYGRELQWEDLPDRRASRVADYMNGDVLNADAHDEYIEWFLSTGLALRKAIDAVAYEVDQEVAGIDLFA